jgi:CopG family transcriptional regulator, nickel-responsive regulator
LGSRSARPQLKLGSVGPTRRRIALAADEPSLYKAGMKVPLTRFGVALETPLLADLDALVRERGCTRSELLRDLARAEVAKSKARRGVRAVATLTLVYDHHVRDLSEKLTALQHELGEQVHSTLHVHLNHDYCLEVIVMRGISTQLQGIADRILATRGVKHGGLEIITGVDEAGSADHAHAVIPRGKALERKKGARHTHPSPEAPAKRART